MRARFCTPIEFCGVMAPAWLNCGACRGIVEQQLQEKLAEVDLSSLDILVSED